MGEATGRPGQDSVTAAHRVRRPRTRSLIGVAFREGRTGTGEAREPQAYVPRVEGSATAAAVRRDD